ncbi:hypothetical protein Q1695_004076 [Nippostrongylus brasiliensis]|nr:hypothetical protein Q1695_004076 [Nippostrongylus brasiliensis]
MGRTGPTADQPRERVYSHDIKHLVSNCPVYIAWEKCCKKPAGSTNMLLTVLSLFFIALAAAQNGQDQFAIPRPFRRCFANEEWDNCASLCQPTCRFPNPGVCSQQCIGDCRCRKGFLRNDNGACVANCSDESSKPVCPKNSEFTDCGSACEPSCRDPRPKTCSLQCVVGCQCKPGFFRNDRNECVAECDNASGNVCSENEEFRQCGTACEPSCENPNPQVCTLQCILNVCQCKPGFFRDSNGKCVATCRGSCGKNEERKKCGTACEPTCANPNPRCTKQCINNVCQCKTGFVRDDSNNCIPLRSCLTDTTTATPASCAEVKCRPGTICAMVEQPYPHEPVIEMIDHGIFWISLFASYD